MKLFFALATALLARTASAHTVFSTVFVNDQRVGDGTCVRMDKDGTSATAPIEGLTGNDMACGRDGNSAVAFSCPAETGDKLTFQYRVSPDASKVGSLAANHKGPCAFYMKRVGADTTASGPGWFKFFEHGYDVGAGKWCTETLRDNGGLLSVTIPSGLPPGNYLVRSELLALHQAYRNDPQYFVGCVQIFITTGAESTSGLDDIPSAQRVSIPGYVNGDEPGLTFNIFADDAAGYVMAGPKVWHPTLPSGGATTTVEQRVSEGKIPDGCLLVNSNWCGIDPPDYDTEAGCWASIEDCYAQGRACYASAQPTGSKNCDAWNDRCRSMEPDCKLAPFTGPENKGEKVTSLDPAPPTSFPGGWSPNAAARYTIGMKRAMVRSRRPRGTRQ